MTAIKPPAAGLSLPPASQPTPAQPKPLPPQAELRPLPLPGKPGLLDRFLTPHRSQQLANTQANQLDSIRKGIQNGSITQEEAGRLLDQQARVAQATAAASADGVITTLEAAKIRRLQGQAGRDVFVASHNRSRETPVDPSVTRRQAAQLGSIAQGVRSGSLTGAEANTVLADQADIARTAGAAQADGEVDFIEGQELGIRQDAASYEIGKEKRDAEKAPHASRLKFPVAL